MALLLQLAWALQQELRHLNKMVVLAMLLIQITVSTVYYFSTFKGIYMRMVNRTRQPVYGSSQLPAHPLRSLAGTLCALAVLTVTVNLLVIHFGITTWQEGARMAAALLLIDACLNARHHFFEGRPLQLFLLHAGYHALVLGMNCCLLALYGHPRGGGSSSGSAAAAAAAAGGARAWVGGARSEL